MLPYYHYQHRGLNDTSKQQRAMMMEQKTNNAGLVVDGLGNALYWLRVSIDGNSMEGHRTGLRVFCFTTHIHSHSFSFRSTSSIMSVRVARSGARSRCALCGTPKTQSDKVSVTESIWWSALQRHRILLSRGQSICQLHVTKQGQVRRCLQAPSTFEITQHIAKQSTTSPSRVSKTPDSQKRRKTSLASPETLFEDWQSYHQVRRCFFRYYH
jgi:hypothetical protein